MSTGDRRRHAYMTGQPYEINIEEGMWRIVTYPRHYTYLEHKCTSLDRPNGIMTTAEPLGSGVGGRWRGEWKVLTFWEDCCGEPCIHCEAKAPKGMQAMFWFLKAAPDQAEQGWP